MPQMLSSLRLSDYILIPTDMGNYPAPETKTDDYIITLEDSVILGDTTSKNIVFQLPLASTSGKAYLIKKIATLNTLTVQPQPGETIDGASSLTILFKNTAFQLVSDGIFWSIF